MTDVAADDEYQDAVDDVRGESLPAKLVEEARALEMEYVAKRRIYKYSTVKEYIQKHCWMTGGTLLRATRYRRHSCMCDAPRDFEAEMVKCGRHCAQQR